MYMNACTVITIHSTSHFIYCLTITLLLMNSRYSFFSSTLIRKTSLGKHLLLHVILFILNQKICSRKMHTFCVHWLLSPQILQVLYYNQSVQGEQNLLFACFHKQIHVIYTRPLIYVLLNFHI